MDRLNKPYRVDTQVLTFEGEWTAEEIDAGVAGEPHESQITSEWYQPTSDGPVQITDAHRIAELEQRLADQQ